jgi:hypothetical protein
MRDENYPLKILIDIYVYYRIPSVCESLTCVVCAARLFMFAGSTELLGRLF